MVNETGTPAVLRGAACTKGELYRKSCIGCKERGIQSKFLEWAPVRGSKGAVML